MSDTVDIVKLFRPQEGDLIIVDFNKVNVTQVENAVANLKVPVIAVHDLSTIKMFGIREQADHSQQVAQLQLENDSQNKEIFRLNRIIKDDMVPKPAPAPIKPETPAVGNLAPKTETKPAEPILKPFVPPPNPIVPSPVSSTPSATDEKHAVADPAPTNTVVQTNPAPLPLPSTGAKTT